MPTATVKATEPAIQSKATEPASTAIPGRMEIQGQLTDRFAGRCPKLGLAFHRYYMHPKPATKGWIADVTTDQFGAPIRGTGREGVVQGETPARQLDSSPAERFGAFKRSLHGGLREVDLRAADPLRDELAEFAKAFPNLAAKAFPTIAAKIQGDHKPSETAMTGLFPFGAVRITRSLYDTLRVFDDEFRGYLARHLAGDQGRFSRSDSGDPATKPEWEFCPQLSPKYFQTADAIKTGFGIVHSRFNLYDEIVQEAERQFRATARRTVSYHRRNGDHIDIITLVAGYHSETIAVSSRDSVSFPG